MKNNFINNKVNCYTMFRYILLLFLVFQSHLLALFIGVGNETDYTVALITASDMNILNNFDMTVAPGGIFYSTTIRGYDRTNQIRTRIINLKGFNMFVVGKNFQLENVDLLIQNLKIENAPLLFTLNTSNDKIYKNLIFKNVTYFPENNSSVNELGDGTLFTLDNSTISGPIKLTTDLKVIPRSSGLTYSYPITGPDSGSKTMYIDKYPLTILQPITGNIGIHIQNGGKLTLKNSDNNYTGTTLISNGTLEFTNNTDLFTSNIENNSSLIFSQENDSSFSPVITGTGNLTKNGLGTLDLINFNNAYTGETLISNGTIRFTDSLSSFASNITNNYLLIFQQNLTSTFSPAISGSGDLIKSGTGTVILSNANNNYTGDTLVSDGSLFFSNNTDAFSSKIFTSDGTSVIFNLHSDSSLKSAITGTGLFTKIGPGTLTLTSLDINYTGDTFISDGALKFTHYTNLFSSNITNNSSLIFEQNVNSVFNSQIIGSGSLTKSGTGTLTLPSLSSLFTGNIIISGGAIRLISNTTTLVNTITINNNASLIFDQDSDSFYNTQITGGGNLIKDNNRTLTLTNTSNNYSGNTTISGGYLKFINDTSNFQSKISINDQAILYFSQSADSSFNSQISGGGQLAKDGAGTLTLSNTSNNYSGSTSISAGALKFTQDTSSFSSKIFTNSGTSIIFDQSSDSSLKSAITGTGILIKNGVGILTLTSSDNSYVGSTTINNGGLKFTNDVTNFLSDITNDASLIFDLGSNTSFNTTITGSGTLTKSGAGSLTLTKTSNNYSGNTTISAGALRFNQDTSSFISDITNNASLIFDQSSNSSFTPQITGVGSLIKNGNRTLTLTNTSNNYSGNTTINGGYLKFIDDTSTFQSKISIASQGILYFSQNSSSSFTPQISGDGQLIKDGPGILTLTNINNNYSGNTTINQGALRFTLDTSSFSSDVTNYASLIFDQSSNSSFNSSILGTGTLTKSGSAILTLTSLDNSYTGGTTINAGTLKFTKDVSNFSSNILNNSNLEFLSNGDHSTFSNTISGTGTLIKNGSNTISFNNTIAQSQLILNTGKFALVSSTITSPITVNSSATFKGAGTIIGNIDVFGTFRVGNSIGTINHTGDYTQNSFSVFQTEITETQASLLNITGNLTIENLTNFEVLLNPGEKYRNFNTYTVITYTGTKIGEFTNAFSSSASLLPILDYSTANQIKMDLLFLNYLESVKTGNPAKVAEYIDELTVSANTDLELIDAHLLILNQKDLFNALNILHPAKYKSLILSQENNFIRLTDKINSYLNSHVINQCGEIKKRKKTNFFNTFFYNFYDQKGEKELFGFKTNTYSDLFGFDFQILRNLYLGPLFAFSYSDTFFSNNFFNGKTYSYYAGIYGSYFSRNGYLNFSKTYSFNEYKVNRKILFSSINRTANSKHLSISSITNLDMGLLRNIKSISINPFLNLNYIHLDEEEFKEKGADSISLQVDDEKYDIYRAEVGFNFSTCNICRKIIPIIKFAYVRESRLNGETYTSKFIDENNEFEVRGIKPTKNRALSSITIKNSLLRDKLILTTKYLNEFGSGYKVHDFSFTLNYNF